jgi:hypothetical protein
MAKVTLLVSVDDEHFELLDDVAERLKKAGMEIGDRLYEIGVITGSANAEKVKALSGVAGVANIEPSQKVSKA